MGRHIGIQILDMLVDIYFSSIFQLACSQSTGGAGLSKTYSKLEKARETQNPTLLASFNLLALLLKANFSLLFSAE